MTAKVIVILFSIISAALGAFPDDPKPCKYGDAECIGKLFEYYVSQKHNGDDSIGLTSIDPLPVKKIPVSVGSDSPVNVDLVVFNGKSDGVSTLKFVKMKGFGKDIAVNHEIVSYSESLTTTGNYNLTGKVLLLPISGSDTCNITLLKTTLTFGWTGVPYEKDGETYMKPDKFYLRLEPQDVIVNFNNLYNDKALSENMNKILNENIKELYAEISPFVDRGFTAIVRKVITKVFATYPYEKFFMN
ncbi:protein takeout-like precursor [Stomoxys calcitrans]|uniref:Takeout-like protein n=1 Tax=Stomoxys calcitrans TaxID=35570 RepID=D2D0D1_STOCA|nr:protein takeout-like precursor [Stomoxys calcitrans]ACO83221.1 takeout-like protein [Stomoxys calcitrans]